MTPEMMAAIHGRAFAAQSRAWGREEFEKLLDCAHVFTVAKLHGFALGRVVADEAELLTIAVEPAQRGQGHGAGLLTAFEQEAAMRAAARAFLEVAEDNEAARALYRAAGYAQIAQRAGYYARPNGARVAALILERPLCSQVSDARSG